MYESLRQFRERHGGDKTAVLVDGKWLLPDGASYDASHAPEQYITRSEPPTDPTSRLRLRRSYVAALLDQKVEAFRRFKAECRDQINMALRQSPATPLPSAPPDAAEQLKEGKCKILALREDLAALDKELSNSEEYAQRRAGEVRHKEYQQRLQKQLADIEAVEV